MGLKKIMKESKQSKEPESKSEIAELQSLIQEQLQTNSKLQSELQKAKSELTKMSEELESLRKRASSVNKTEIEAKALIEQAEKEKAGAIRDSRRDWERADKAERDAIKARDRADEAEYRMKKAEKERKEAISKVGSAEYTVRNCQMTYKSLFVGSLIFSVITAFFLAYEKRTFLPSLGKWLNNRWNDAVGFLNGLKLLFMAWVDFLPHNFKIDVLWGYLFALVLSVVVCVGLFFAGRWVKSVLDKMWEEFDRSVNDKVLKNVVTANIVLLMLYICLFFGDSLAESFGLNIVSIWLIMSITGVAIWYCREIKDVLS